MKTLQKFLILGISALLLTSCFGKTETPSNEVSNNKSNSNNSTAVNGVPSQELLTKINAETQERQRVAKLDTLTDDNLKTQTEIKDGKNILKDRRLLINFLKSKTVNSVQKLIESLDEVKAFAKKSNIELTEADIMTIIAATDVETTSWDMCGDYTANKGSLDTANASVKTLIQLCGVPEVTPSAEKK